VSDADFTPSWVRDHIPPLLTDAARLESMSRAASGLLPADADDALAMMVMEAAP
jgi:UDP-N-acetylglucosamine--N-acetylmuramyl-(pentapeptide) pyrophosphoryl-undecaprenol N-acetylglucosamine transferase